MDCIICLETTDRKSRSPSSCPFCTQTVCRTCMQTYLLQDDVTDPVCPNTDCKKTWTQTFLCATLTATFRLGPYKDHREKVLFDREKARLPDTQDEAKRYKDAVTIYEPAHAELLCVQKLLKTIPEKTTYETLYTRYGVLRRKAFCEERAKNTTGTYDELETIACDRPDVKALRVEYKAAEKAYKTASRPLKDQIKNLHGQIVSVQYAATHYGHGRVAAEEPKQRRAFVMKCPQSTCEGFLSMQYKCGLCEVHVCAHCHIVKKEEHMCDPDLVETIKHIRKETKPCPKCAALISKIDGCDQMWCTQCHTPFSWTTGAMATGVVHNPHYFQYLRETGQAIPRADNPGFACGAVNNLDRTLTHLARAVPAALPLVETFRTLSHVRDIDLMIRRRTLTGYNEQEWRRQLRVQRLVGEIDEAKWKTVLQQHEKAFHKDTAWVQLLEMYTTVSLETMAELTRTSDAEVVAQVAGRLTTIREYSLQEAEKVAKMYGCVIPEGIRSKTTE
jgi:hypothetical protein